MSTGVMLIDLEKRLIHLKCWDQQPAAAGKYSNLSTHTHRTNFLSEINKTGINCI
jgi:hypothetical protein